MTSTKAPRIALLFTQFSAYHVDRCEAVARRLAGRAEVLAVEVATRSEVYAWDPSGQVMGATKLTLFPGADYDRINKVRRLWSQFRALRRCRMVLIGISYREPDVLALTWLLSLVGVRVVLLSESKFDDFPRRVGFEWLKSIALSAFSAAIVGANRQLDYYRFLGFRKRLVLPGYDTVSIERVRRMGRASEDQNGADFAGKPFVFVGRFVAKKNLTELIDAYAAYVRQAGPTARRLVLAGSGPEEASLRQQVAGLDLEKLVEFPGFLSAEDTARLMAGALALVLPSRIEQWGLVVNEALAFGLPVIVSDRVGAGDILVRNLINGYVIEPGSIAGFAAAMLNLGSDEVRWNAMASASKDRAWLGDTERLADAVELLLYPHAEGLAQRIESFLYAGGLEHEQVAQTADPRP